MKSTISLDFFDWPARLHNSYGRYNGFNQGYDLGLYMILGTFNDAGMAHLYEVGNFYDSNGALQGLVRSHLFPGHWSIGTGAYNANLRLNFRNQQLGLNPKQSAFHAYEAKVMASQAPTVNRNLEVIVAFADRHYVLTDEHPEAVGCPVSIPQLKQMFEEYGPRDTNALGHPMPVNRSKVTIEEVTIWRGAQRETEPGRVVCEWG